MLSQLHTPIPVKTPKGKAWAIAIIDYGPQWDLQWVTFIHATGECWTFRNQEIRQEQNYTHGLPQPLPMLAQSEQAMMRSDVPMAGNAVTPALYPAMNGAVKQ